MSQIDAGAGSAGLARDAIGLREVLFQSITHMAPAAAVAFSIIVGAGFAGGALALSVLFALIACRSPSPLESWHATCPRPAVCTRTWRGASIQRQGF